MQGWDALMWFTQETPHSQIESAYEEENLNLQSEKGT